MESAIREGAQRLRDGADIVLRVGDLEGVHLLRTSARRLRATVKHLGGRLDRARRRALSRELRWFMRALGPVRDLHVFLSTVDESPDLSRVDAERLRAFARKAIERKAPRMRSVLEGARFATLLSSLDPSVSLDAPRPSEAEDAPCGILHALSSTLQLRPCSWEKAEPERLHDLRKSVKRLRYTLEACAPQFGRPVRRQIERCRALQEALGALQDVCTFRRILQANRSFAAGQFIATAQARVASVRASLPQLWQKAFSPGRLARLGAHLFRRTASAVSAPTAPTPVLVQLPTASIAAAEATPRSCGA